MTNRIAGVILAGGLSRRMGGGEKFLIELDGVTLLERVGQRLTPQVATCVISANCAPEKLPALHLPVLPDAGLSRGPLSGILAGLEWANAIGGIEYMVTAAADTPFLPRDLVERLLAARSDSLIAMVTCAGRKHPTFALWNIEARPLLTRHLADTEDASVLRFAESAGLALVEFPSHNGHDPFFNINTPTDLNAARRMAQEMGA